ncbi:hypothetical protein PMIN06_006633 [Paraphaeosphaeria minitans]
MRSKSIEDFSSQQTLGRISASMSCIAGADSSCCRCVVQALPRLPNEILMYSIWPYIMSTFFQKATPICGQLSYLLEELRAWPARDYQASGHADIFATHLAFGGTSYIVYLCNKSTAGSSLVKPEGVRFDHIVVWLDNIGITATEFLSSDSRPSCRPKNEWVYRVTAAGGLIYIKSKGIILERIATAVGSSPRIVELIRNAFLNSVRAVFEHSRSIDLSRNTPSLCSSRRFTWLLGGIQRL